jgi:hypothetical protein
MKIYRGKAALLLVTIFVSLCHGLVWGQEKLPAVWRSSYSYRPEKIMLASNQFDANFSNHGVKMLPESGCTDIELSLIRKEKNFVNIPAAEGFLRCKVLPSNSSISVVAFAGKESDSEIPDGANSGEVSYGLDIYLVGSERGNLLSHYGKKNMFIADADGQGDIAFRGIMIDTARYNLADGIRAFGVKSAFAGRGTTARYESQKLNLYIYTDGKIKPVMEGLDVIDVGGDGCSRSVSTVGMASTLSHGFFDMVVNEVDSDSCVAVTAPKKNKYILHFNGTKYVIPQK